MAVNRQVRLAARPVGFPKSSDFEMTEDSVPEPADGQVLVRNSFISVDPYMRGRMNDVKSYVPPFEIGEPMQGGAVGVVAESRHADFAAGDAVTGSQGWREYDVVPGKAVRKLDLSLAPMPAYLGIMGGTGFTAYVGLLDLGQPREGETVFVSAAAGAVGSIVGQLARIHGCRVVGSAGNDDKVAYLQDELGFDAAFNYKTADLEEALAEHCPSGIDVYFENVGGDHLQAALNHLNPFGRVPVCGMISQYNNAEPAPGPNNLGMIVRKRLTLQGFIISDHMERRPAFEAAMGRWLREGKVKHDETIVHGIEHAVDAFLGMLQGQNTGKMLVKVGPAQGEG